MLAEQITSPSIDRAQLTPFPTHSSELFVVAKNANSFGIKQIHTLAAKHPGYGLPDPKTIRPAGVLSALCFHGLTNSFSHNIFPFTLIQIAPRVGGVEGTKDHARELFIQMRNLQGGTRATYSQPLIDSTQSSD